MRSKAMRMSALAALLSGAALLSAVSITTAAPQHKAKKPPVPKAIAGGSVTDGKKVYDANGCGACHAVAGKGGKTGPELTKIGADKKWTAAKLTGVVRDPKKTLHTEKMPGYGADKISDKEMKNLVAYLQSLK